MRRQKSKVCVGGDVKVVLSPKENLEEKLNPTGIMAESQLPS